MQRFKPSDPVFIIPKFAHLYPDHSALVVEAKENPFRPMFNQYTLQFADRSTAKLLEFQIIEDVPQCDTVIASLAFDSQHEITSMKIRGPHSDRQIILQTPAFYIDMRIHTMKSRGSIMGQIKEKRTKNQLTNLEVRLLREAMPISRAMMDRFGVFEFLDAPRGTLNILVTLPQPSSRIFGTFSI
jgi:hypothetical protein